MTALHEKEQAVIAVELLLYTFGTVGNFLVIFMILYLGEHKKTTHWYMLQLAVADIIYMQALPFAVSDIVNGEWTYSDWFCTTKQTIKFINYYGSVMFLMIMAIDRYLAVCHGLSRLTQKIRSQRFCYWITALTWILAIILCVPVMMYSGKTRRVKHCQCRLEFPTDAYEWCSLQYYNETAITRCVEKEFGDHMDYLKTEESCDRNGEIHDSGVYSGDYFSHPDNFSGISESNKSSVLDDYYNYGDLYDDELYTSESKREEPGDLVPCYYSTVKPGFISFIYANFLIMFLLPLTVITICYGLIIARIRKTTLRSNRHGVSLVTKQKKSSYRLKSRSQKRVTIMCGSLVLAFGACWLPFHALHLAKIKGFRTYPATCESLQYVIDIFVYANSAFNPYLYNFLCSTSNRFREIWKHKRTGRVLKLIRLTRTGSRADEAQSSRISRIPTTQNSLSAVEDLILKDMQ